MPPVASCFLLCLYSVFVQSVAFLPFCVSFLLCRSSVVFGGPTCVIMFPTMTPKHNTAPRKEGPSGPSIFSNVSTNSVLSLTPNFDLAERFAKSSVLVKLYSENSVSKSSLWTILGRIWNVQPRWSFKEPRPGVFAIQLNQRLTVKKFLKDALGLSIIRC